MYALSGYINQNAVIANENISSFEGCNVIITVLDNATDIQSINKTTYDQQKKAARNLAGLWANHGNN